MFSTVTQALNFMTKAEKLKFRLFLCSRSFVALFDLVGILAIGLLATSIALFLTQGSDRNRTINFAGVEFTAVTAQTLPAAAVLILLLFLGKALLSILLTRQLAFFLAKVEARAAMVIARQAFNLGLSETRKFSRDEVSYAVQFGSARAFNGLLNNVGVIIAEGFLFTLVMLSFFLINPKVAIASALYFGLVVIILQFLLGRPMYLAGQKVNEGTVNSNLAISDLSSIHRESFVLGKNEYFYKKIYDAKYIAASGSANQFMLSGMPRYIIETALLIGVALFVLVQSSSGNIVEVAGTLGIFLSGGLRLTAALLPLQNALLQIRGDLPAAKSALDFLSIRNSSHISSMANSTLSSVSDNGVEVQINDVSFAYSKTLVETLVEINITIYPGQQVALIGPSGAGKSTLADLILGLLIPSNGQILINGKPPVDQIRSEPGLVAYVPQNPGMISGTIAENIALGVQLEEIDQTRLASAIQGAHLQDVIDSLPEGVNSFLGKRQDELSGGQLQRIGIARALYNKPGLLILDEATSSLDASSESEITKILEEMKGHVTVVLIAHRLNTVQKSDVAFLLENGSVTASGTFSELLRENSTVKELVSLMSVEPEEKAK